MIQNSWDEKMVKLAHAGDREAEEALIQKYKTPGEEEGSFLLYGRS